MKTIEQLIKEFHEACPGLDWVDGTLRGTLWDAYDLGVSEAGLYSGAVFTELDEIEAAQELQNGGSTLEAEQANDPGGAGRASGA